MATRIRISTMDTGSPFVAGGVVRGWIHHAPARSNRRPSPLQSRWKGSRGADEQACKPDPVPRSLTARGSATIHLGPPSPAGSSDLPAGSDGAPPNACAAPVREPLGLAPGGVYRAAPVTRGAGGLLHHRFTLTARSSREAVCSLWHFPAGRPGLPLTTTLPCGVRTFLGGGHARRRGRPACSSAPKG